MDSQETPLEGSLLSDLDWQTITAVTSTVTGSDHHADDAVLQYYPLASPTRPMSVPLSGQMYATKPQDAQWGRQHAYEWIMQQQVQV